MTEIKPNIASNDDRVCSGEVCPFSATWGNGWECAKERPGSSEFEYIQEGDFCRPWYRARVKDLEAVVEPLKEALAPGGPGLEMWTDGAGRVLVRRGGGDGVAAQGYDIQEGARRDPLADALTRLVGVFEQNICGYAIVHGKLPEEGL